MNQDPFWAERLNQTLQNRKRLATGEVVFAAEISKVNALLINSDDYQGVAKSPPCGGFRGLLKY
jgi:hypothetical protein